MSEIFFDVLEINIVVSIIFLALFLLSGKLRKRYGAGWMKLAWALLAVRLLIPYNFSLGNPVLHIVPDFLNSGQEGESAGTFVGIHGTFPDWENVAGNEDGVNGTGIYSDGTAGMTDAAGLAEAGGAKADMEGDDNNGDMGSSPINPDAKPADENAPKENAQNRNRVQRIIPLVWALGVAACFAYCLIGYVCFSLSFRKNLLPITDIKLRKQILELERRINGKAGIPVYQSRKIKSPMLVGVFVPRLILPAGKRKWSETELNLVVSHELCHYRNRDLWLKFIMMAAWCVNWFNPFVWMLKKQFFYEMELACDSSVLAGYDREMREVYAKIMLSFVGKKGGSATFSTGFGESKKQMKKRIDYMMDSKVKKKGIIGIAMTFALILAMGLLVSCGGRVEEDTSEEQGTGQGVEADSAGQDSMEDGASQEEMEQPVPEDDGESMIPYNPNHEYNEMIRVYGTDIYIARKDGIYRLSDDGESEELLYANDYRMKRGMEIYQDSLYFCGSVKRGEQDAATIYRMDLNSHEVKDALAAFSQVFDAFYNITVYEGKLYVADSYSIRVGFELDESGEIMKMLDAEAEDFLFQEDNAYFSLQQKIWNNEAVFGSEEYWDIVDRMSGMYRSMIDAAACKKMLNGNQVVLKYKDELLTSIYLEKEDGTYEFLCDTIGYPAIATETGVYYFPDEGFDIWYVDYETKNQQKIWEKGIQDLGEIQLINYDQEYLYFTCSNRIDTDQENDVVYENYVMRVPRWAKESAEKVYRFETDRNLGSLWRNCGVINGKMFFNEYETISLDPDENGMTENQFE